MEIVPIKQEYDFSIMQHTMRAVAEHTQRERKISYYFDKKLVSSKILPAGSYLTDDDYIREIVENYSKNNTGVYADIFKRHSDKVLLTAKTLDVDLVNNGIVIRAHVKVEKEYYNIELSTDSGENMFAGRFKAVSFSEVLEKMRIFINTLDGVSVELAQNINALSNDKIEEIINWE